jgi:hypothetical protein
MTNDMEKIAEIIQQVPTMLRALAQEVAAAREKTAGLEKQAQAEALVAEMEERGLVDPDAPRHEKVAALLNSDQDLDVMAQAVRMRVGDLSPGMVDEQSGLGDSNALATYLTS